MILTAIKQDTGELQMTKKYHVQGSYLQWFECFIEADSQAEAEEIALSGDADYMMMDCDDWSIDNAKQIKK
jgi:hypothetical protein